MIEDDIVDYSRIQGMDPAANWLLGPGSDTFLPQQDRTPIPFLLETSDPETLRIFESLPPMAEEGGTGNGTLLPRYRDAPPSAAFGFLAFATRGWFRRLVEPTDPRLEAFRAAEKKIYVFSPVRCRSDLLTLLPDFEAMELPDPEVKETFPPGSVVVGVIDDGIAFAHERFRDASGRSRVWSHWSMDRFPGEEILKPAIDDLLATHGSGGQVDEDAVYRAAGLIDYRRCGHKAVDRRVSHGTHVLDLAAGADPAANAIDRPIIAVSLPSTVLADTSGRHLDWFVALAILHILRRAAQFAGGRPVPVVINASIGYIAGPHDGQLPLEALIDTVSALKGPPVRVVLPAGNAHQSRCHAEIPLDATGPIEIGWTVLPDDLTVSSVQVWMPAGESGPPAASRLSLTVTMPGGAPVTQHETADAPKVLRDGSGAKVGLLQYRFVGAGVQRGRFEIWTRPTAQLEPAAAPVAPAGRWTLTFERTLAVPGAQANAWIQRDDSLFGYPQRGRQSRFDHPLYQRYDPLGFPVQDDPQGEACPVRRRSLLNPIATGRHVLVAGGYEEETGRLAPYSSGGPNTPPEPAPRVKPDALLPSEGSRALPGVLAAGPRSGSVVALSGTSVAAPQLVRILADRLAAGLDASRPAVQTLVAAGDPQANQLPPERRGSGRLPRPDQRPLQRRSPA